jgi:ZIP family zinc transporter
LATIGGVLIMWGLVSYLHSGDAHTHGSTTAIHEEHEGEEHEGEEHEGEEHEGEEHHDHEEEVHTE